MNPCIVFMDSRFVSGSITTYYRFMLSLQKAIARVVDEELDELLQQCSFYSLMVDESTDVTTTT